MFWKICWGDATGSPDRYMYKNPYAILSCISLIINLSGGKMHVILSVILFLKPELCNENITVIIQSNNTLEWTERWKKGK